MNPTMHLNGKKLFRSYKIFSSYLFYTFPYVRCSTYKNTLFLPKTNFPHKVSPSNRRERDRLVENSTNFEELYEWQRSQDRKYEFILHDGPPYANGDVHIGHAVNKVLKDITVRFKLLQGYKIHFVPGWDCHGLPIELKVLKECDTQNCKADLVVRKKAYEFSQKTKERQLLSFKDWGILADWKNNYFTCHPSYVVKQLQVFQDLYDKGIVYQDHKPVFWSPFNKTSLAEAELEYNSSHVSPSIYVKFGIIKYPDFIKTMLKPQCSLNALVWTTTPWTLPANQAVCYSADKRYCIVMCKNSQDYYIIAEEMASSLASTLKTEFVSIFSFEGSCLKDFRYSHPVHKDRECLMFPAHHVTMTKGTGLVHTAPNHGLDDYIAAMKQNLPLDICLVDDNGCFTNDAGLELSGKEVLSEGTKHIINMLSQDIVYLEDYVHSYPYDWRSKTPVIIKSSHQWFINVQEFQMQAINCLQDVKVFPEHLKSAFLNQLKSAPQWCISRQRYWGVPIPAFYQSGSKTPVVHRLLTDHLCQLIEKHGIHCWWEMDVKDLLPSNLIKKCGLQDGIYERGSDILDIWLDSGISWKNVLPEPYVSDVCIEGVDQIRGWFNSSLMTSVALRGKAPYKSLVFHGFTTDADGHKMSKSEGNVISPVDIINGSKKGKVPAYGIDVLRWWIASHACQHENIPVKMQVFEECSQSINKLRNMLKFLLGSLSEFNPNEDIISPLKMRPLDVHMLHLLKSFSQKVQEDYNNFQYKNVTKSIVNFSTNEVSSFYFHLIKDRLYCDQKDSTERLSCQTVLYYVLNSLVQSIGAICPHLAEDVMMHHPNKEFMAQGLFRSSLPSLDSFLSGIANPYCVELANQIRQAILRADIRTLNLHALIIGRGAVTKALDDLNNHVPGDSGCTEFFQVSSLAFGKEIPSSIPETAEIIKGELKCSTGIKHKTLLDVRQRTGTMSKYWTSMKTADNKPALVTSDKRESLQSGPTMTTYINAPELLNSEIKWVLKCVNNHFSLNSCEGISSLFAEMFPDSNLAKQFSCGPTKCAYIISYGLAPYFKSELSRSLNNLDYYTLMFDESLNKTTQSKQMDVLIRYWDENKNHVKTRYFTSVFLGHSTADITLKTLLSALEKLSISKILNVSMDGLAVNWKIYKLLEEKLQRENNCILLNVGSCSLHILNNCFKSGAKAAGWDIDNLLVSLYWLFKDSPARREDFLVVSNGANMPKKFCAHRWLENVPAAERAVEIWEHVVSYVEAVEKGKFAKPTCKSYKVVFQFTKDQLTVVKLQCFISILNILRPFMIHYQSDFPLLPFLADDIKNIIFDCLQNFNILKSEKICELKKAYKICHFDFDAKSFSPISRISLGFIGDKHLKELSFKKKVSDKEVMDIKYEVQKFICTVAKDIINKSSIKFLVIRNINCLDPRYMAEHSSECYVKMKRVLSTLVETKKLSEEVCDSTLFQFNEFLNNVVCNNWKDFNPCETRLDEFFYKLIGTEKKYEKVFQVIKMFLVVSHGQGAVERGFSMNKYLEVENLQEEAYIAKRLVLDELKQCGGVQNINITKELRISVAGARQKYLAHLQEKKLQSAKSDNNRKRKQLDGEINELKQKKLCLQKTVEELQKSADSLAEKAEETASVKYITQSNSFRRTAKEKLAQVEEIDSKINHMLCELKKIK